MRSIIPIFAVSKEENPTHFFANIYLLAEEMGYGQEEYRNLGFLKDWISAAYFIRRKNEHMKAVIQGISTYEDGSEKTVMFPWVYQDMTSATPALSNNYTLWQQVSFLDLEFALVCLKLKAAGIAGVLCQEMSEDKPVGRKTLHTSVANVFLTNEGWKQGEIPFLDFHEGEKRFFEIVLFNRYGKEVFFSDLNIQL